MGIFQATCEFIGTYYFLSLNVYLLVFWSNLRLKYSIIFKTVCINYTEVAWLRIKFVDCKAESLYQTVIYQTVDILIDNLK